MIYGQILRENLIKVIGQDGSYLTTSINFYDIPVKIDAQDKGDEYLQKALKKLNEDFPIFKKNFNKYIKAEFDQLVPKAAQWGMNVSSTKELMEMAKLSSVIYSVYNSKYGSFTCVYNDGPDRNYDFFEGHSFWVEFSVQNGKFHCSERGTLQG